MEARRFRQKFDYPLGITVDTVGNLFVADQHNHRIRKIDTFGTITTVVGTGTSGYYGDGGPATAAEISFPNYIRMDSVGSLLITDNGNQRIRRVDTNGIITTIAGTGVLGYSGDGGPATAAKLNSPGGTTMDKYGNIFICDVDNDRIRKIDAVTGYITTVAGIGVPGYSGDGGPATAAELNQPVDITVDHYNNVYFVDWNNSRIREFNSPPPATSTCDTVTGVSISAITASTANLSWTAVIGSLGYEYTVNTTATPPTTSGTYTAATNVTVTGLLPGQNYYAHVLDSCGTSSLSAWVNVPFTTTTLTAGCDTITGVSISAITASTANLSWTAVAGSLGYEYTVNTTATSPTTSGTYTAATNVTLTGLLPGQNYYAHVLDSCGSSSLSAWVNAPFMTTLSTSSIRGSNGIDVIAFPNPVKDLLTFQINGNIGTNAHLIIDDITGQHITTLNVSENATLVQMKNLHSGIYFFRYVDNEHVQTLSIIKK